MAASRVKKKKRLHSFITHLQALTVMRMIDVGEILFQSWPEGGSL